ncbi:MAG: TIGR00730 family Rossman fold protein [Caulobacteraceae bacterium]
MNLCVYCGTSFGDDPAYLAAARATARMLAEQGIGIVYGGAIVGLMGAVADAALAAGGRVIGVMPQALVEREIAHKGLSESYVTQGMHERKALMEQLSDGFIALPGGPGTLEEIVEQWTWGLLGIHAKPCGFLNVNGYYDSLEAMTRRMVAEGFLQKQYADMLIFTDDPADLLARFHGYAPPPPKWSPAAITRP